MVRVDWEGLDASARAVIEAETGPVLAARTAAAGRNAQVAAFLETPGGTVFVKGVRTAHPGVVTQRREAVVNRYVHPISPALLWQIESAEWSLLGFEHIPGHHANYAPGSPDLPKVLDAMARLAQVCCPDLKPLKRAEQRWAAYVDNPADQGLLAGHTLLHTDYNPDNILVSGPTAWLIDWAWPTKGAAFIDPACLVVRLIFAGHDPAGAEALVADLPAWKTAEARAVDVYAGVLQRMWTEIAQADPSAWKITTLAAATAWHTHRQGSRHG